MDADDSEERLKSHEVVEGGDSGDLEGMLIASAKARDGKVLGDGESKGECVPL